MSVLIVGEPTGTQLDDAVLAKGFSNAVESQRVTRPVVRGHRIPDAFASGESIAA
jgi:hypothetical protein